MQFYAADVAKADASGKAAGLFLIAWGIFTAYMLIAALRTNVGLVVVFALLLVTFFLLGIGDAGGHTGLTKAGGYLGLVTAAAAWYCSFAGVLSSTFGRPILPLMPLKR